MPGTAGPNIGFTWGYTPGEDGWGVAGFNPNWARTDTLLHLAVLEITATPPGTPANGDRYIVGAGPTGAWTGHAEKIAVWLTTGTPAWVFYIPKEGWRAFNIDTQSFFQFDGSDWVEDTAGSIFNITTPAENDVLVYDAGTSKFINARPLRAFGFGSDPSSVLTADQEIFYVKLPCDFTILADFGDYRSSGTTFGGTAVAADGDVVFRLQHADAATPLTFTDVGEITIDNGTVVVLTLDSSAVDIECLRDDVLRILAPTVPDSGFKGPFGSLVGFEPEP